MKRVGAYFAAKAVLQKPIAKEEIAEHVLSEVAQQTANYLQDQAAAWVSENKLIHAGAALKLAEQLKKK